MFGLSQASEDILEGLRKDTSWVSHNHDLLVYANEQLVAENEQLRASEAALRARIVRCEVGEVLGKE